MDDTTKNRLQRKVEEKHQLRLPKQYFDFMLEMVAGIDYGLTADKLEADVLVSSDDWVRAYKIATADSPPKSARKPIRKRTKRGSYHKCFHERYDLNSFLGLHEARKAECWLMGEEFTGPTTDRELYEAYKEQLALRSPSLPPTYIAPTFEAFKQACHRLKTELQNLTEQDRSDWTVGMFLTAMENMATGSNPSEDDLSKSFQVVRDKRKGIEPEWRGKLDCWSVYDFAEQAVNRTAESMLADPNYPGRGTQADPQPESTIWEPLDENASAQDTVLYLGSHFGWPKCGLRPGVTIPAGEESWRAFASQMSPADEARAALIATAIAEETRLDAAYREKQDAKAKKAAQDEPQSESTNEAKP